MTTKVFKKLLALVLSLTLILSCGLTVSATDNTNKHSEDEIETIKTIAHDYLYDSIDGAPLEIAIGDKPYDLDFNGYTFAKFFSCLGIISCIFDLNKKNFSIYSITNSKINCNSSQSVI